MRMSSSVRGGGNENQIASPAHIELYEVLQGLRDLAKRLWPVGRAHRGVLQSQDESVSGLGEKPHGADQASMAECWRRYSRR